MHAPIHLATPLYRQVAEKILQQLAEGILKPGQCLPSEWDLARQLQVSQGTVRKGLSELVAQGVLVRQQGVGTYITHKNAEWGDYPLVEAGALQQLQVAPVWPRQEVLSVTSVMADDEVAARLQLRGQALVWKLLVLWRNGHQAVALDEAYLPVAWLSELNIHFVHRRMGIYDFLQLHYGLLLHSEQQFFSLCGLTHEVARLLRVKEHIPAWCWSRLCMTSLAQPLEWRRRFLAPGSLMLQTAGVGVG